MLDGLLPASSADPKGRIATFPPMLNPPHPDLYTRSASRPSPLNIRPPSRVAAYGPPTAEAVESGGEKGVARDRCR